MSRIAIRERIDTETTEPDAYSDTYHTIEYQQFAWQCLGCGLVWPRKSLATDCESRQHVSHFEAGPYGGYVENGVHKGGRWYPRSAIRRDKPAVCDADDKAFEAWCEHVAALRVPKDTSLVPAWKAQGILPNERMPGVIDRLGPGGLRLWARSNARRIMAD